MTDKRLKKEVGKRVRVLRLRNELTQEDMMDHKFERRYYQRIEAGQVNLCLESLNKLAKAFKVSLRDLFDFD